MDLVSLVQPFAWPIAAAIVGTVLAVTQRTPIAGLISRTKSISTKGLETGPPHLPERQKMDAPEHSLDPLEESAFDNQTRLAIEKELKRRLGNLNLKTPEERESFLARILAKNHIEFTFFRISTEIFGSQVEALVELSYRKTLPLDAIRHHYDKIAEAHPEVFNDNFPFAQWLHFLAIKELAKVDQKDITIRQAGIDFLAYLVYAGLARPRPY